MYVCVHSVVSNSAIPWTVDCQAPLSNLVARGKKCRQEVLPLTAVRTFAYLLKKREREKRTVNSNTTHTDLQKREVVRN